MEDLLGLLEVSRQHTKTARNVLRTLAGLYAELEKQLDALALELDQRTNPDAESKEAERDEHSQGERAA